MTRSRFNEVFDKDILPFIDELQMNNSLVRKKNLDVCKEEIYNRYMELRTDLKDRIFGDKSEDNVLDRHKIAACMCAAFLEVSVFYKNKIVDAVKQKGEKFETYFYYVNEMVAFHAGCVFLCIFMTNDCINDVKKAEYVINKFPKLPPVKKSTVSLYENIVYDLSQVKTAQIGLDHFDTYIYSMFFFMLESYFYTQAA